VSDVAALAPLAGFRSHVPERDAPDQMLGRGMKASPEGVTRRTLLAGAGAAAALPLPALAAPIERFPLWPKAPPGGAGLQVRDATVRRSTDGPVDDIAWPHVATPMLGVVPAAQPNGAAILYVPGGGYARVAVGREGSGIARAFAARGFTVFELL
jgi:acetyl esterase/lipase